jgi:hypothetical protein
MKLGVSYIPPHQPIHIEADLKHMKEIGCTDVLFALQENHFQWLNGAIRYGPKIAKDHGLRPSALIWGYANTSGGGRSSKIMLENPDMWQCGEDGKPYGGGFPHPSMCYNNPKAVVKYAEYIEHCKASGFESICIDEPSPQNCFCKWCQQIFFESFSKNIVDSKNSSNYKLFRSNTVINFVANSLKSIKAIDEQLETSLCMMPIDRELFERVASIEYLDVFGIDPYWIRAINGLTLEGAVELTRYAKNLAKKNKKLFELFLCGFGITAGLEKENYLGSKLLAQEDPDYLFTWSFRGGIGLQGEEECDNPEIAWKYTVDLHKQLSQRHVNKTKHLSFVET